MEVVYPCCCGLDVHKKSITACVLWAEAKGNAAMESTGGYWKPVWNILAEQFEVLLVKAQHSKAVPAGRRTRKTASGWRTCCSMDYSGGVSCLHDRHANSATSRGIG
jgi:transposase